MTEDKDRKEIAGYQEIIIRETASSNLNILFDNAFKSRAAYQEIYAEKDKPFVSILIIGYNNLQKHTKYCVESILKYTADIDYELVLLDNGSSDGTLEYFKSVPHNKKKIIRVTNNKGGNFGVYLATQYLTGRYAVMIANDVYVTKNWLSNIIKCAESDERIGFVATASDYISNLQAVNLTFSSLEEMQLKAERYNISDPRKWEERLRLMPAIAFYKRECLDIIGSLDYAFQHDFSDDDISIRIRRAGYKLMFCGDVFVHHEGPTATSSTPREKFELLKTGKDIFRQKYFGIDAWDDANNFELLMLNLINPEELRGKSKPSVLGIDVKCGTPILQLKNKLRLADIFDTELSAFVQDPKYWLDLKTICEGKVIVDRIEFLLEHFSSESFDYILLGNPLNSYPESDKILNNILSLLKSEGQLLIKLRNHFDPHVFLKSAGKDYPNGNKSVSHSDIDHLNQVLMQNGYTVKDIKLALQPLDDATKEAVCDVIKQTCADDKIEATFRELTAEEYALRILNRGNVQPEALNDKTCGLPQQKATTFATDNPLYCHFRHPAMMTGMTSIIVLTHNHLEQTRKCLKSIRKYTPESHEIIFVDNASTDGTVKWLQAQIKDNKNDHLIENKEEGGYAARINQGITLARGEHILLLTNYVVVGPDWVKGMTTCLNKALDAGIIGPMTNRATGIQQITDESYRTLDYLEKYATAFLGKYQYRRIPCRNLVDICLLFRRKLVEKIGLLDDTFTTGDLASEDFCLRAALAGHTNYIAGDVFVHNSLERTSYPARNIIERKWTLSNASPDGRDLLVLKSKELAADFHEKGNTEQAIEALVDCIKIIPDHPAIYYEMIRIFLELKRYSDAWEVVTAMPDHAKDALKGLEYAGYVKEGLGLDDEAADYADRMIALDADYAPALNLKGVLTYKKGEEDQSAEYFKKAIAVDPSFGEAYTNLGVLHWRAGKNENALLSLRKGFSLSPSVPDTGSLYYSVVSALGCFNEAEADFREACALSPHNKSLTFLYIDVLLQQGKWHAAMNKIEDALAVFGLDEGILKAALDIREKIGPRRIDEVARRNTLSLCMIVKNEEKHLVRCLYSVRDIVDEIIIVDTGSTDQTIDIAKVFGARVFEFPWTGDFSEARNHSLKQATGDWILILDADEVISAQDLDELKTLISKASTTPVAYSITTRNYTRSVGVIGWVRNNGQFSEEAGPGWVGSDKVRLFKRSADILFSGPVHEMVEESLRALKIPILRCKIAVHHYGKLDVEKELKKGEEYYYLGKMKYENNPTDISYINELAKQAQVLGKYEESVDLWLKLIALLKADPHNYQEMSRISYGEPISEIYIQLAAAYLMLDRYEEALMAARNMIEATPKIKEYIHIYAHCEIIAGSLDRAASALKELLATTADYVPALFMIAVIDCLEGKTEHAREIFQTLKQDRVEITPLLNQIAHQLQDHGKRDEALTVLKAAVEFGLHDEETTELLGAFSDG